jgi:hypothetical protein
VYSMYSILSSVETLKRNIFGQLRYVTLREDVTCDDAHVPAEKSEQLFDDWSARQTLMASPSARIAGMSSFFFFLAYSSRPCT